MLYGGRFVKNVNITKSSSGARGTREDCHKKKVCKKVAYGRS